MRSGRRESRHVWIVKEPFEDFVGVVGCVRRHQKLYPIDSGKGLGAELAWQETEYALGFEHVSG